MTLPRRAPPPTSAAQTLPLWSALEVLHGARRAGHADDALLARIGVPAGARGDAAHPIPKSIPSTMNATSRSSTSPSIN